MQLLLQQKSITQTKGKTCMNILKSIGAVIAGLVAIFALSYATDAVLEAAGILQSGMPLPMRGSELLITTILVYRLVYSVVGCYIAARLAPNYPMRHALVLGALGFVGSIGGAIVAVQQSLGPAWYAWGLVVFALPCAWLGGRLYANSQSH
jgi:multisubunit Na+/H+ antiporter MnhF subunit